MDQIKGVIRSSYIPFICDIDGVRRSNIKHVVAYPEVGLIYNRIKKSGNSSVILYLSDALKGRNKWSDGDYYSAKYDALTSGVELSNLPATDLRSLSNYYSFTIFRNPYVRCLSAFIQKVGDGRTGFSKVPGFQRNSKDGFKDFVTFLEDGGLYYDKHWWPQVDLLAWTPEQFSHIGKLEQLDSEIRYIFGQIGKRIPDSLEMGKPHPAEFKGKTEGNRSKVTNSMDRLEEYYSPELYEKVYNLYKKDFDIGGYSKI